METSHSPQHDFAQIYEQHFGRVFGLCRYLLNSFEGAQDAAHEVFLRAQRKMATYDPSQPLSTWLLGIASHHCIDLLRRRGLELRLFQSDAAEDLQPDSARPSALSEILASERGDAVRDALAELPDKLRIPLVLTYYNELSYDEIAAALDLKRSHVATLIFRAKQKMRRTLSRREAIQGEEKRHGLS